MNSAGTKTRPTFKHLPIDRNERQIRLFRLSPRLKGGLMQCKVFHRELTHGPNDPRLSPKQISCDAYRALSYEWGPPEPMRPILVNGAKFLIRDNLWQFLNILRKTGAIEYALWADQICIDQTHSEERNHQVRLMSVIYTNAIGVLAFLGFCTRFTEEVRDALYQNERVLDYHRRSGCFRLISPCIDCRCIDCSRKRNPGGFEYIFSASYWTRVWIVQELTLAPEIHLFINNHTLPSQSLICFGKLCQTRGRFSTTEPTIITYILSMLTKDPDQSALTLEQCLKKFLWPHLRCIDPRDLLYALVGLVKAEERPIIDYDLPMEVVVENTLVRFLFDFSNLRMTYLKLQECGVIIDTLRQAMGLPHYWYRWLRLEADCSGTHFSWSYTNLARAISSSLNMSGMDTRRWSDQALSKILRVAMVSLEPSLYRDHDTDKLRIKQRSVREWKLLRSYTVTLDDLDPRDLSSFLYETILAWTDSGSTDAELLDLLASELLSDSTLNQAAPRPMDSDDVPPCPLRARALSSPISNDEAAEESETDS